MLTYSDVTGKEFESNDAVYFRSLDQCGYYLGHGGILLDIFSDSQDKLICVFSRDDHERLFPLWKSLAE